MHKAGVFFLVVTWPGWNTGSA